MFIINELLNKLWVKGGRELSWAECDNKTWHDMITADKQLLIQDPSISSLKTQLIDLKALCLAVLKGLKMMMTGSLEGSLDLQLLTGYFVELPFWDIFTWLWHPNYPHHISLTRTFLALTVNSQHLSNLLCPYCQRFYEYNIYLSLCSRKVFYYSVGVTQFSQQEIVYFVHWSTLFCQKEKNELKQMLSTKVLIFVFYQPGDKSVMSCFWMLEELFLIIRKTDM